MIPRYVYSIPLLAACALAQQPEPLIPGRTVQQQMSGQEKHVFSIAMQAGQTAAIRLRNLSVDFGARVVTPDGAVADFAVPQRAGEVETAGFTASTAGDYRIEISALYRGSTGRYEIRLDGIRAATEHDRRLFEALKLTTDAVRLAKADEYTGGTAAARRSLEIIQQELGEQDIATPRSLAKTGWFEAQLCAYDRAEPMLRRALELQEQMRGAEHPETLLTVRWLGALYRDAGDYGRAEPLLSRALDVTGKTFGKDHPETADCIRSLAMLHYFRGDLAKAIEEYQQALAILERALGPDDQEVITLLNNLAVAYNSRREYTRAEALLDRIIAAVRKTDGYRSARLALPLWNLALIAQQYHKDQARALDLYSKALVLIEESKGPDHPDVASVLNNTANVYKSLGDGARALEMHNRVHEMWEKSLGPYHDRTVLSLGNIARTYATMGDAANTIRLQTRADEALEKNLALNLAAGSERQKLAFFDSVSERTDRTISYQVRLAPDSQDAARLAALAALQRKGRILDAMSLNLASLRERMDPQGRALLDGWNAATSQYARLTLSGPGLLSRTDYQKKLADLAEKRDRAEAEVGRRSAEFLGQLHPVTLDAVAAAIPRNAALVEFASWRPFDPQKDNSEAYGERRYIAYVLRSTGPVRWKELGAAKEIDAAVQAFRQTLSDPERADVRAAARALDRLVMEPVRALAPGATQLLIAPEGPVNLVPFQALVDQHGRYLVERYSIAYLSSGRDLLRLATPRTSRGAPVIVADPFFGESKSAAATHALTAPTRSVNIAADLKELYFAPLAGAAEEARAIRALFPEARVLAGKDATETALKHVQSPSILHIASHGFFLPAAPGARAENPLLRSGLALTGANQRTGGEDDGIFTALEASGLNLWGTKLVTLSACDTGIGEVRSGEGVYGLRRAFLLAGAESLVMSLWPVSDYITRQTMTAF
ncbi:MAG TPA: CHAT domain-containing protein, partial [Bryobacteraceae bacterium]